MRARQLRKLARQRVRDRDAIAIIVREGMAKIYAPMAYADPYPMTDDILTYLEARTREDA